MAKIFTFLLASLLCLNIAYCQDITGSWYGNPDVGVNRMRITFHITKTENGYSATMDSPDQGVIGIPVDSVNFEYPELTIKISRIFFIYKGEVKEDGTIDGAITQMGKTFPAPLSRKEIKRNRPQTPHPPYTYKSENITFRNEKDNISLAGTITYPDKGKSAPAVVLISGSGGQDRNEELFEHKPFLVLSDYLTRHEIAVLRVDDRGVGESEGDLSTATSADLMNDVKSAVDYLKSRKEIDNKNIGLIGHSEGGIIAFMLAANYPQDVAFIVSMAGAGVRGDSILLDQRDAFFKQMGYNEEYRKVLRSIMRQSFTYLNETNDKEVLKQKFTELFGKMQSPKDIEIMVEQLSNAWMKYFLNHDPAHDLKRVKCPVLAINGEKDVQVLAKENLESIEKNIEGNGNKNVRTIQYPDLNHLFQTSKTGMPQEYAEIEETINPKVLQDITLWILETVK